MPMLEVKNHTHRENLKSVAKRPAAIPHQTHMETCKVNSPPAHVCLPTTVRKLSTAVIARSVPRKRRGNPAGNLLYYTNV